VPLIDSKQRRGTPDQPFVDSLSAEMLKTPREASRILSVSSSGQGDETYQAAPEPPTAPCRGLPAGPPLLSANDDGNDSLIVLCRCHVERSLDRLIQPG
jgi:hypothetical protein